MAPERYHSNVLELLTPPRTPCARLRKSRPAPRSLTGTVVREAADGRAISAPMPSRFHGGCPVSSGRGAGGSGWLAVPRAGTLLSPMSTTRHLTMRRRSRPPRSRRPRFPSDGVRDGVRRGPRRPCVRVSRPSAGLRMRLLGSVPWVAASYSASSCCSAKSE